MTTSEWSGLFVWSGLAGLIIYLGRMDRQRARARAVEQAARREAERALEPCGNTFFGYPCNLPRGHAQKRHEHKVGNSLITWPREEPKS